MSILCKVHNRGPGGHTIFDAYGSQKTVEAGQTVDVEMTEGTFRSLKPYFDDRNAGLDLVSSEVGDLKKQDTEENQRKLAADLVDSTETHEVRQNPDPNAPLNPDPTKPLNPDPNFIAPRAAAPPLQPVTHVTGNEPLVTGSVNEGAGAGAGAGAFNRGVGGVTSAVNEGAGAGAGAFNEGAGGAGAAVQGDTVDKLLSEVDAKSVTFPQLRSRAKALLGNDFPLGTSPKMDEIVDLLRTAQKKQRAKG